MKRIITLSTLILLVVIISSSRKAKAQDKKDIKEKRTIIITDRDTIINGKKFSEASAQEKEELRKKLKDVHVRIEGLGVNVAGDDVYEVRRGTGDVRVIARPRIHEEDIVVVGKDGKTRASVRPRIATRGSGDVVIVEDGEHKVIAGHPFTWRGGSAARIFHADTSLFSMHGDTAFLKKFNFKLDSNIRSKIFAYGNGGVFPRAYAGTVYGGRKNSQSFSYSHTDNEGITTRNTFSVSDASKEQFKKVTGVDGENALTLSSVSIVPDFDSGKTTIKFKLAGAAADVKLTDGNGKAIASGKTVNGVFEQSVELPRNGAWYLSVNQSGKWTVKRLVKE